MQVISCVLHCVPAAVDDDVMEIGTALFGYAGELGDVNALYTYAHLLKQGE